MGLEADTNSKDLIDVQDKAEAAFDNQVESTPDPPVQASPTPEPNTSAQEPVAQSAPEPPSQEPPSAGPTNYSKEVNDLLLEHGGNIEAAAKHYFELKNAVLARQAEPVQQQAPRETPATAPVESLDPDVQRFDSRLRTIDAEFQELDTKFREKTAKQGELQEQIDGIVREIANPELETDLQALSKELRKLQSQKGRLDAEVNRIRADGKAFLSEKDNLTSLKNQAVRLATLYQAREAEQRTQEAQQVSQFRVTYDSTAAQVAETKVPKDLREDFLSWAEATTFRYLRTPTGKDHQGNPIFTNYVEDLGGWTTALADRFLAMMDKHHRVKSSEYSQLKAADATVNSGNGAAVAPETKRPRSVAEWDARDEELDLDSMAT